MGNERDVFDPPDPGRTAERLGRTLAPSRERARRSLLDSKRSPLAGDEQITLIPTTTPTAVTQPTAPPTPPTALIPPEPPEGTPAPAAVGRRATWEPAPVEPDEAETRRYRTTETRGTRRTGPSITPWKPGDEEEDAPAAPSATPIAGSTARGRSAGLPIAGSIATLSPIPRREAPVPVQGHPAPADPPAAPEATAPDEAARPAPTQPVWEESPAEGPPQRDEPPRVQRVTTNTAWDPEPSEEVPYPASLDNAAVPRVFVEDLVEAEPPPAPAAKASQAMWIWTATIVVLFAIGIAALIVISGGALFHGPPAASPKPAPAATPQPTDGPSPWGPLPDAQNGPQ